MRVARVPSASTSHGIEAPKAATERRQILGGRYTVLKELGRGASGVVLLCRRKEDHVLFAVKEIVTGTDVAERKRIYEEGRLMLNIPPHPSIVRIEEVSESRESVFLVIEYVPDGSLHDLVYTDEVLDIQERRREDKRRKDSKHDRKEVRRQRRLARHVRKLARDSPSAAAEHHDAPGGGGGRGWGESNSDWADGNTHRSHQASDAGTPTHGGGGFGSAGRNALMGLFAQESVGGAAVQRVVSSGGFSAGDDVWGDDGVAEAYHMGDSPWGHDGDFDHRTPTDELSSLTTDGDEKDGEGDDSSDNDRDPPGVEAPPPRPVPFLKEATVSAWMSQLANAVEYLHSLRIAHRDIKLENILISSGGAVVKVCDFGVAATIPEHHPHRGGGSVVAATPTARGTMLGLKPQSAQSTIRPLMAAAIQHSTASPRRLPEGPLVDSHNSGVGGFLEHTTVGTPQYMPPEICDGRAHDLKCDVWSLGVTFYELCARELPFEATNMLALMHRIMEEPAAPLPHPPYSPHLSAIILAMLTKEPSRRPSISQVTQMFQFYRKCRARFEQDAEEEMLRQLSQRRSSAAGSMSDDAAAPGLRNPLLDGWFSDMPFSGDLGVPGFTPAPQPTNFRTLDEMMRAGSANTSFAARSTASSALASIDSSAFTPFHPIAAEGVFPGPPTTASGMVSVVEVPARFSVPPPLQPTNLELALLHPPIRNSHQPNPLNHLGTSPLTGESVSSRSESGSCSPTTTESRSSFAGISPESARILASIILPSSANTPRRNVHSAQPSLGGGRGGSGRISLNNGAKGSSSLSGSGNDAPRRDSSAESVIDTPSTTPTPPATKNSQLVNAMNSGQLPPRPPGLNRAVVAGMARTAGTAEGLSAAMAAKADVLRELQEMGELVSSTTMMSGSHSLRKVGASPIHDAGPRWVSDSQSDALSHGDPKPKTAPMGGGVRAGGRLGGGSSSNVLDATPQQVGTNHAGGLRTPFSGFQLSPDALQMRGNAPPAPPARSSISGGGGGVAPGASPTSESPVNASFALGRPLPFAALVGGGVNGWSASTLDESATLQKNAVASSSSINPNASGILETSAHLGHATSGGDTGSFENTPLTTGRRHGNPWRHHHGDVGESPLDGVRNIPTPGGSSSLSAVEGDLCHNGVVANDDDSSQGGGADNNVFLHSTALAAFLSGGGEFLEAGEVPPLNTFGSLQSTLGTTTYVVLRAGEGEKSEGGGTLPYGAKRQEMLGSLADGDLNTSAQTATNDETPTKLGKSPFAASPNSATASPEVLRRTQSGAGDGGPNELTEMGITGDSSEDEGAELRFAASPYSALKRREPHSEGLQPPPRHRRETASYDGGVEGQGGDSPTRGEIVSTIAAYNAAPPDVNKSMQELLREENEREARERRILARARSGARTSSQETPLVRGTKGDSRSASFGDDSSSQSPGQASFSTHSPEPGPPLTTTTVGPVTGAVLPLGIDVGGGRDPRYTWRLPTVPPSEPAVLSPTAVHTLPSGNNSVLAGIFDVENANGSSSTTNRLARNSSLVAADVSLISLPVSTVNNRMLLPGNTAANRPDASRSLLNDFRAAEEGASRRESTYSEVGVLTNTITPRPSLVDVPKALGPSGSDVVLEDLLDETPRHGTSCHPHTPPLRPVDGGDSTHSDHARLHHAAAANHHHRSRRHSASGSGNPLLVPSSLGVGLQQGTSYGTTVADAAPFSIAPPLTIPHPGVTYRKDSTGSSGGGTLGPPEDADVPRRRVSSMWGLDGPISSQQYANPHHSRTSTSSFREGNGGREGAGRNGDPRSIDGYDAESSERFPGYEEFTPTNGDVSKGSGATPPTRTPRVPPPAVRGGCPCVIC